MATKKKSPSGGTKAEKFKVIEVRPEDLGRRKPRVSGWGVQQDTWPGSAAPTGTESLRQADSAGSKVVDERRTVIRSDDPGAPVVVVTITTSVQVFPPGSKFEQLRSRGESAWGGGDVWPGSDAPAENRSESGRGSSAWGGGDVWPGSDAPAENRGEMGRGASAWGGGDVWPGSDAPSGNRPGAPETHQRGKSKKR